MNSYSTDDPGRAHAVLRQQLGITVKRTKGIHHLCRTNLHSFPNYDVVFSIKRFDYHTAPTMIYLD